MISSQSYESNHFGDGKVGVFDQLLPVVRETGDRCTVDYSVVAAVAYVDDLTLHYLVVVEPWEGLQLSYGYDAGLRG